MAKDLRTAGEVAPHLKLNMPELKQAVAYWTDANGKLGKGADHTEIFRYAEMLAEEEDMTRPFPLSTLTSTCAPTRARVAMEGRRRSSGPSIAERTGSRRARPPDGARDGPERRDWRSLGSAIPPATRS